MPEKVTPSKIMTAEDWFNNMYGHVGSSVVTSSMHEYAVYCLLAKEQDAWISVVTPPKIGEDVLVLYSYGKQDVCTYDTIFDTSHFIANSLVRDEFVIFWQPLPAARNK